mgnify:CR=1 FL=1
MSKDIKEMNSVEYADYMVQSTRNWKNQQAAAYRKDMKKQQRREDWKTLLGLGAQEFVNNSENRLKQMHITNLPKTINYAANLAQGNAIQEERLGLLDKYGTPENIWSAQAASRAFTSPAISKYKSPLPLPLRAGIPLPFNLICLPACAPIGTFTRDVFPSIFGTSISPPKAALLLLEFFLASSAKSSPLFIFIISESALF